MEWHSVLSGLIGGAAAAALGYWSLRSQKGAKRDQDNWRQLGTGWLLHFAFFGSVAFAGFMLWLYLFVGSARADAATQELFTVLLFIAFATASLWLLWHYYLVSVHWRDAALRVRRLGRVHEYAASQIVRKRYVSWRSEYVLEFDDGRRIVFSPYARGGIELAEALNLPLP
jgi:hypothetical protein